MSGYFRIDESNIKKYIRKNGFLKDVENMECVEIGDGNLNYIFRVSDKLLMKSFVLKQADDFARISHDIVLSRSRNSYEANAMLYVDTICPGYVPKIYFIDKGLSCFVMEDLGSKNNVKDLFMQCQIIDAFARDMAEYLANQYYYTSQFCLNKDEQEKIKSFLNNREMCDITVKLVFEDPYIFKKTERTYLGQNIDYINDKLINNQYILKKVHEYKNVFISKKQSFIHGDLHTGSLCYSKSHIKILDYEFAFYGPIGYDLGNLLAHCIFAVVYAKTMISKDQNYKYFAEWLVNNISYFFEFFFEYIRQKIADDAKFIEFYKELVIDINAFCSTEIIRRILGIAKSKEMLCLDKAHVAFTEKVLLDLCIHIIMNDDKFGLVNYYTFLDEYIKVN